MKPSRILSLSLSSLVWAQLPLVPLLKINAAEVQDGSEILMVDQLSIEEIKDLAEPGNDLYSSEKVIEASIIYEQIVELLEAPSTLR